MTFDDFEKLHALAAGPALVALPETEPTDFGDDLDDWCEADPDGHTLLDALDAQADAQRLRQLQLEARRRVLHTLAGAMGMGAVVSRLDHDGGNVLTLKNAKEGGADLAEQGRLRAFQRRQERGRWNASTEQKDAAWSRAGGSNDEYTGEGLTGPAEVDHVVSCSEMKKDGAVDFYMDDAEGQATMTAPENLRVTSRSNNRSKGSKKAADWDREGVDRDRLMDADRVARRHIERKVQRAAFIDRGKRLAVTGVAEGAKMGLQQLIGFVVAELVNGCFDEVGEMLNEGGDRQPRALARELKTRSRRVMERVVARWREALDAFKDGALSGFFSNLVTFLINRIWRTGKNVVRALREGVFGLGRALKMGLRADSTEQGWHDASKVLVTSGLVVGAVFVEEALQGAMGGSVLLLPLAPLLAPVIAGLLAGLATVLATWLLDRMDLFGAVEMQRAGEVDAWLDALLDAPRRPTGLSPSSLQLA